MICLSDLKNTIAAAIKSNSIESFSAKKNNEHRSISIVCSYSSLLDKTQDVFPFWKIVLTEEDITKTIFCDGNDIKKVMGIYNIFTSQGIGESYINDDMLPY